MRAQPCYLGEFEKPELVCQTCVDVIDDTSHLERREPALARDCRALRRFIVAQQVNSQYRGEPLDIEASARAAFTQLAPAKRAKPSDHRIVDADRRPHREI